MEAWSAFIDFVKELGFPIACVIALFWQNTKITENHKQETEKLAEALNNNTAAIMELKNKLGG